MRFNSWRVKAGQPDAHGIGSARWKARSRVEFRVGVRDSPDEEGSSYAAQAIRSIPAQII